MICPNCEAWRPKRQWKPSQWAHGNPVSGGYNCCKVCSPDGFLVTAGQEDDAFTKCVELYTIFLHCVQGRWLPHLQRFFEYWVSEEHAWRKELSHHGALRKTKPLDPIHWKDEKNVFFDPGNYHYEHCYTALFGNSNCWSQEMIGDITEGLLGYQYLRRKGDIRRNIRGKDDFPNAFVNFLHDWNLAVYHLCQATSFQLGYEDMFRRIRTASVGVSIRVIN